MLLKFISLHKKNQKEVPQEVLEWLKTEDAQKFIEQASGYSNPRQIGYDSCRIDSTSGKQVNPNTIVLTFSGKPDLNETVSSLEKKHFANNFIIDYDGSIYPITNYCE